jgi:hypothetical protein
VLRYLVEVPQRQEAVGQILEIGCGQRYTYAEMVRLCAKAMGRRARIIPVPVLTPRLSSYWLHLVTSVDLNVARALIDGLKNDTVVNDRSVQEIVPFDLLSLSEALDLALNVSSGPGPIPSRWSDAWARQPGTDVSGKKDDASRRMPLRDYRMLETELSPDQLFAQVLEIGGKNGYGRSVDALWRLRGGIDRAIGGTGLRRGRPTARSLAVGDPLDFWRVKELDREGRRLVLIAEMYVPGTALLDLRVEELDSGGARLHQLATLSRENILSSVYWYTIAPLHGVVFQRLMQHIATLTSANQSVE